MATATSTTPAPTQGLRRELGLASTTSAVIGGIIAVGIFLTPAGMAKALGSPMWLLLVWLVIGAMTMSGALCFGELAGRFPSAGGAYIYLKECYGPPHRIPVRMDVPAGDGSRHHRLIGHRPGRILRLHRPPASAVDQARGRRGHLGSVPLEHLQHSDECGILALDDLAETRPAGISDGLGVCLPAGIVVELRALCGAASRFFAAGAGPCRRSGGCVLLFRWMVGCQQDRRRSPRPGPHSAARFAARVACRDRGLHRGQRGISVSRSLWKR